MRRLGLPGIAGAILLAACAAFLVIALKPLEERHAALLERSLETAKRLPGPTGVVPVSSGSGRLASFYAFFQAEGTAEDHLARLHAIARHAGVAGKAAEYRLAESRGLRLVEYSVSMPVSGSYSQIRVFLERALEQIPVLALEHVSVRRRQVTDPNVEADVRFTVYLAS